MMVFGCCTAASDWHRMLIKSLNVPALALHAHSQEARSQESRQVP